MSIIHWILKHYDDVVMPNEKCILTDKYNPKEYAGIIDDIISELNYMKDFMKRLFNIYTKYNVNNLFDNLDIDALHSAYQMERENKGLPVIFIR